MEQPWSAQKNTLIAELRSTQERGLTARQVQATLTRVGYNEFQQSRHRSWFDSLLGQLTSPFALVLLAATALALLQGAVVDAWVITAVVTFNSMIGAWQEHKAERVMSKLQHVLSPHARVIRDGIETKIAARYVVPGDLVVLDAGDRVPADGRILEAQSLRANQASLTGESVPAHKSEGQLGVKTALIDRTNMLFASTLIVAGRAVMLVTTTGNQTEIGQIAAQINAAGDLPPGFRREIGQLGLYLLIAGMTLALMVLGTGLLRGIPLTSIAQVAISILVSIIPEGLPVAVTFGLSYGAIRMHRHQVIVRRLAAVERLGYVDVIGLDKTGTLTANEMTVENLFVLGHEYQVTGAGYQLSGQFLEKEKTIDIHKQPAARLLLELSSLATMSTINEQDLKSDQAKQLTDPTETALAVVAAKAGYYAFRDERNHPELLEIPFDQELRFSTSVHRFDRIARYIVKGAPEQILKRSKRVLGSTGATRSLLKATRELFEEQIRSYAKAGYRVVALAYADQPAGASLDAKHVTNLTLVGLMALSDPIRPQAATTIAQARDGGIRVLMITGDHLLTSQTVADRLGLTEDGNVVHADELRPNELDRVCAIARATPGDKLKIIRWFQEKGKVVAMTGDGVNDAPALKQADVGIAMGRHGTDVAIEAADVVLLRDQFSDLLSSIMIGRWIWQNLRRIAFFFLITSLGDATVVTLALVFDMPLPLVATQILWLNLVTGALIALALVVETPKEVEVGSQAVLPPLRPGLLERRTGIRAIGLSLFMGIAAFFVFLTVPSDNLAVRQTAVLITLFVFEALALLTARRLDRPAHLKNRPSNLLILSLLGSVLLQLGAVYWPVLNEALHTTALELPILLYCVSVALAGWLLERLAQGLRSLIITWAHRQPPSAGASVVVRRR